MEQSSRNGTQFTIDMLTQATFRALNVEYDDQVDEEPDNTKELQIEEALKHHQTALKLQCQNVWSSKDTEEAYRALFELELFKYPEALSEYSRVQEYGDSYDLYTDEVVTTYKAGNLESGPSTLPQIIHVSFRNRALFRIEALRHRIQKDGAPDANARKDTIAALDDLAEALDKDADDVDSWRRSARLAWTLKGRRIPRFCLEAVVDGDEQGTDALLGDAGVEIKLADLELRELKNDIGDNPSKYTTVARSEELPARFVEQLALYPDLSLPAAPSEPLADAVTVSAHADWASVARVLAETLRGHDQDFPRREYIRIAFLEVQGNDKVISFVPEKALASAPLSRIETSIEQIPEDTIKSPQTTELPTRKRSLEIDGDAEEGRVRSKRLRARQSIVGDARDADGRGVDTSEAEASIKSSTQADDWLFGLLNPLLNRLKVKTPSSSAALRKMVRKEQFDDDNNAETSQAVVDLYNLMQVWNEANTKMLTDLESVGESEQDGLLTFLDRAEQTQSAGDEPYTDNLDSFVHEVNADSLCGIEVARKLIINLLCQNPGGQYCKTPFVTTKWPTLLKESVTAIAVLLDPLLTITVTSGLEKKNHFVPVELSQALFELHLDAFAAAVDGEVGTLAKNKAQIMLEKWSDLARDCLAKQTSDDNFLVTRHLWATVFQLQLTSGCSQDHLIACVTQLKVEADVMGGYSLPNSLVIPDLSSAAAEREISRLETMDFFTNVFRKNALPAVELIENLEPLLEITAQEVESGTVTLPSIANQTLLRFFAEANPPLRLSMWARLRDAYESIDYPPKMIFIDLRRIEIMLATLRSDEHLNKCEEERQSVLLSMLRKISDILHQVWSLSSASNAFECFEVDHIQRSMQTLVDLWIILFAISLFDDYSQLGGKGGSSVNPFRTYPSESFHSASIMFHDMQILTLMLMYKLFCEAMTQLPTLFLKPQEERLAFLRYVHYVLGIRRICKAGDSTFLLFMKDELMHNLPEVHHQSSDDLAQVLNDLYDLHLFTSPIERQDHGCDADHLEIQTAAELIDFVLDKANKINPNQLVKSEIGKTIEKLHPTLEWRVRSNAAALRNRKEIQAVLEGPVLPISLYNSLKGMGTMSLTPANPDDAVLSTGWYYLKGQLAHAKYRLVRSKGSQGPEEELDLAVGYYMKEVENRPEQWEPWYRLAQTYVSMLDEKVSWSAEDMNDEIDQIVRVQKQALHCFIMATAMANQSAEVTEETKTKMAEMYHDFASCLYGATREPYSMQAFIFEEYPEKFYSRASLDRGHIHKPLSKDVAWKFASVMLARGASGNKSWLLHYSRVKCLWKLHSRCGHGLENSRAVVLKALQECMDSLPDRKEMRQQDPTLEPIYKAVSVINKLVMSKEMTTEAGAAFLEEALSQQKQIDASKRPAYTPDSKWNTHVIDLLKIIRAADKPRWHHRPVMRAARIMYEQDKTAAGAAAAKDYLLEQHIYSQKSMQLTTWKPEHERPGRRFVYMTRYLLFLAELLDKTKDLEAVQLLAKRVRRRSADFFDHIEVWTAVVELHLRLHREHGGIPHAEHDVVFRNVDQEEFQATALRVDEEIASPTRLAHVQTALQEVGELKKINQNLIKHGGIDDLLADAYAMLWQSVRKDFAYQPQSHAPTPLPVPEPAKEVKEVEVRRNVMSLDSMMNADGGTHARPPPPQQPPPPQPEALQSVLALSRPRARLISRREYVKRATDSVAAKPALAAARAPSPGKVAPEKRVAVVVTKPAPPLGGVGGNDEDDDDTALSSPPPSVHDSADDEIDQSEADGSDNDVDMDNDNEGSGHGTDGMPEVVVKPRFPGLVARGSFAIAGGAPAAPPPDNDSSVQPSVEHRDAPQKAEATGGAEPSAGLGAESGAEVVSVQTPDKMDVD